MGGSVERALDAAALKAHIQEHGPMASREFLAHSMAAYYAKGPEIGARGDFYTANNVTLFASTLKAYVDDARTRLPGARLVELGGGAGTLGAALGVDVAVEPHVGLARRQADHGLHVVGALSELEPAPTILVANEVLDALPVHRVVKRADGFHSIAVDVVGDRFVEVDTPLTPQLAVAVERLDPFLELGDKAEVCLDAHALLDEITRIAPSCVALFLDYGGTPADLYGEAHPNGTLRGFRAHRVCSAYEAPGQHDITADVDLPWVTTHAQRTGWRVVTLSKQGEFFARFGLVEAMQGALQRGEVETYAAGKNLLMGMPTFHAIELERGLAP